MAGLSRDDLVRLRSDPYAGLLQPYYYANASSYDEAVGIARAEYERKLPSMVQSWKAAGNTVYNLTSEQVTESVYGMSAEEADAEVEDEEDAY